jgi:hypothetical protein
VSHTMYPSLHCRRRPEHLVVALHAARGALGDARAAGLSDWCEAKLDRLASCSAKKLTAKR